MKKLLLSLVLLSSLSFLNSCTPTNLAEEDDQEIIFESTDKEDLPSPGSDDDDEVEG